MCLSYFILVPFLHPFSSLPFGVSLPLFYPFSLFHSPPSLNYFLPLSLCHLHLCVSFVQLGAHMLNHAQIRNKMFNFELMIMSRNN